MRVSFRLSKTLQILLVFVLILLPGCLESFEDRDERPVRFGLKLKMKRYDMDLGAPIYIRIFKEDSVLEVWKQTRSGAYALLETYPICRWSGELGPKIEEGDRQAPEGFYTVTPALMNPNSNYHLSFNIGYPNAFDRAHGRTGSHLMVHGGCSSRGCYAMENEPVEDIYALARESLRGGQSAFYVHAFPFRMTPENMARHAHSPHIPFWWMLKTGYDHFEIARRPPHVKVCEQRYVFNVKPVSSTAEFVPALPCPAYTLSPDLFERVSAKRDRDYTRFLELMTISPAPALVPVAETAAPDEENHLEEQPLFAGGEE